MKIVFAHKSFPAQFGAFGAWLAQRGWAVTFLTADQQAQPPQKCQMARTPAPAKPTPGVGHLARNFEAAMLTNQSFGAAAFALRRDHGLVPDIVMAHSGQGAGSFAKSVWPEAHFVPYLEWYYRYPHVDQTDDIQRGPAEDGRAKAQARNTPILLDLANSDAAQAPTHFQAAQFPDLFQHHLTVLHDGVDCRRIAPDPAAALDIAGLSLPEDAELVTYATRGMELHRGFPQFMRVLERLQKRRPRLHAVIGGEDRIAYGAQLPEGQSWKQRMLAELDLDLSRVHFTGLLPRGAHIRLMQASDVHVYFTVPFVLSWSLIEAMSAGCALVASDVAPVREALAQGESALLVDHDDIDASAAAIEQLLSDRDQAVHLGATARREAIKRYDRSWLWPARAAWLEELRRSAPPV